MANEAATAFGSVKRSDDDGSGQIAWPIGSGTVVAVVEGSVVELVWVVVLVSLVELDGGDADEIVVVGAALVVEIDVAIVGVMVVAVVAVLPVVAVSSPASTMTATKAAATAMNAAAIASHMAVREDDGPGRGAGDGAGDVSVSIAQHNGFGEADPGIVRQP